MKTTKNPNRIDGINEKAVDAFAWRVAEILTLTEIIQNAASEHFDTTPEEIHWGHVGDATRTRDALKEICDRIRGEGEYATKTTDSE